MTPAGLNVFDSTIQDTNLWLKEIGEEEEIGPDRQRAYHVLRAALQALRDRLTVEEGAHLAAQLPMLTRGIYYEGWRPSEVPKVSRSREQFVGEIAKRLGNIGPIDPEAGARAACRVLSRHITPGEIEDVCASLPENIRALFPPSAEVQR